MTGELKLNDSDEALNSVAETVRFFSAYLESYSYNEKKFRDLETLMQSAIRYVQELKQDHELHMVDICASENRDTVNEAELENCKTKIRSCTEKLDALAKYYEECRKYMSDETSRCRNSEEICANTVVLAKKCTKLLEYYKKWK